METNASREKIYQSIFNYFSKVFTIDANEYSSKRKKLHLPRIPFKLLIDLLNDASSIFKSEPNILRISPPLVVVGDIHGHILDLFRILKTVGCPPLNPDHTNSNDEKDINNKYSTDANSELLAQKTPNSRFLRGYNSHPTIQSTSPKTLDQDNNIPDTNSSPKSNEPQIKYLFLGDFVDRGQFSFETILLILIMKILFPTEILIVRGNHEFKEIYSQGLQCFGHELRDLYSNQSEDVSEAFDNCFSYIPLAAIIDDDIICLHGGIGTSLKDADLHLLDSQISRPIHSFDNLVVSDILWSDPSEYILNFQPSSRGSGYLFGVNVLDHFLDSCSLHLMIRAHQCVEGGILSLWDDRCLTVFSASNYCGALNNKSGILRITKKDEQSQKNLSVKAIVFNPIPILSRSAAVFDELSKCDVFLASFPTNCLPSITNGSFLIAKPRTPKPGSRRSRFEKRPKSQLVSESSSECRTTSHSASPSVGALYRKQIEKDKILMPQPYLHRHSKKSHESMSFQPLKKGPLV